MAVVAVGTGGVVLRYLRAEFVCCVGARVLVFWGFRYVGSRVEVLVEGGFRCFGFTGLGL